MLIIWVILINTILGVLKKCYKLELHFEVFRMNGMMYYVIKLFHGGQGWGIGEEEIKSYVLTE